MRPFTDESGRDWVATAIEEDTPRHHGRWYLVFHPTTAETPLLSMPEVRWQTRATAERTIRTMSLFELQRRVAALARRAGLDDATAPRPDVHRSVGAG